MVNRHKSLYFWRFWPVSSIWSEVKQFFASFDSVIVPTIRSDAYTSRASHFGVNDDNNKTDTLIFAQWYARGMMFGTFPGGVWQKLLYLHAELIECRYLILFCGFSEELHLYHLFYTRKPANCNAFCVYIWRPCSTLMFAKVLAYGGRSKPRSCTTLLISHTNSLLHVEILYINNPCFDNLLAMYTDILDIFAT